MNGGGGEPPESRKGEGRRRTGTKAREAGGGGNAKGCTSRRRGIMPKERNPKEERNAQEKKDACVPRTNPEQSSTQMTRSCRTKVRTEDPEGEGGDLANQDGGSAADGEREANEKGREAVGRQGGKTYREMGSHGGE